MFSGLSYEDRAVELNIDGRAQWMPRIIEIGEYPLDLQFGGRRSQVADISVGQASAKHRQEGIARYDENRQIRSRFGKREGRRRWGR
jgi:hypothetical protein